MNDPAGRPVETLRLLLDKLVDWLIQRQGREVDAETAYREAVAARDAFAAGDPDAARAILARLERAGPSAADADRIRRYGLDARGRTAGPTGG